MGGISEFGAQQPPVGLYESLVTIRLAAELGTLVDAVAEFGDLEPSETPEVFARFVSDVARRAFDNTPAADRGELLNAVLLALSSSEAIDSDSHPQQLLEVRDDRLALSVTPRPSTALADSALLTNAKGEPSMGAELRAELASADHVDLLCAFVRWQGIRVLEEALTLLQARGIPFRVITTTYVGATERRALDELVGRFGAKVHVNYETHATRLHAKAWLFRRNSGFDTAYVGSSNLSHSALVDGLEWNVRLSHVGAPSLLRKFQATFDSYWNDPSFEEYDPARDGARLDAALGRGADFGSGNTELELSGLEVTARNHQRAMLEALEAEREVHGRHRNIIIAATGTGKTVVAALDYRALLQKHGSPLRLLFVAHRKEILEQSLRVYREVMMDGSFGELYVDGAKPEKWDHVFASVQSLNAYGPERLDPARFDVVVIDEFHHAEAATYRKLLKSLAPRELLGLTATPERSDGTNVVNEFFGGRAAAELRLWDALEAQILVPFQYFGIADDVDLSGVQWKRGSYDASELDALYTGNDARTAKVIRALKDKVTDVHAMKALGFCVTVAHATYMAKTFNEAGIRSELVSTDTPSARRSQILKDLKAGKVNCVFAVDLFNEGLDVPQVDTVLLLRPTHSATVFLQQLGRGLRVFPGKAMLTVLDFIGQQRQEYRFDVRYRAVTGIGRATLTRQIEGGFPFLPSGTQIILDRVVQKIVLDNVKRQLKMTAKQLAADVRIHAAGRPEQDYTLALYLEDSGYELRELYRRTTWTELTRAAGIQPTTIPTLRNPKEEIALLKRMSALLHVDDPQRAESYSRLLSPQSGAYAQLSFIDQTYARMLISTLWRDGGGFATYDEALEHLRRFLQIDSEISQILALAADSARTIPGPLGIGLEAVPLFTHARYRREEVLAALGLADLEQSKHASNHREGVAWAEALKVDALFVTLHKSERQFSPNTMYKDYAINGSLFHWESQNTTSVASTAGRRYLDRRGHDSTILLFVRRSDLDEDGFTEPFMCLGQVDYVEHVGERPIAITWRLQREMPTATLLSSSAVAR
jgi:superfamily II DNA or RNA helicase/HKD family nuclease